MNTNFVSRGGFLPADITNFVPGGSLPESGQLFTRGASLSPEALDMIERGDYGSDLQSTQQNMGKLIAEMQRAITSGTSNLPIRENLEAEAKLLIPIETPVRNMLPRVEGWGTASAWRTITSVGGGYNVSTTTSTTATGTSKTVASSIGMRVGDSLYFVTSGTYATITAIASATAITTTSVATASGETVLFGPYRQGPDAAAVQAFFSESGAPADHATTYGAPSASYKLMGTYFSVTGFAMAAGRTFQNQLAMEKTNAIRTLMLNEENALINAQSTQTGWTAGDAWGPGTAPWGTGGTTYAYDGLLSKITVANGTPASQVQTSVGALTIAHIDAQLARLWTQGGTGTYIIMNGQEMLSIKHLFEAASTGLGAYRLVIDSRNDGVGGAKISGVWHPLTGELVTFLPSRFCPAGTMIFGSRYLPDGSPGADVSVLPQVQLPQLAPTDQIQGYVAQELAPAVTAPQVYPGIVTLFSVPRLKSQLHFAKSTGVTAV